MKTLTILGSILAAALVISLAWSFFASPLSGTLFTAVLYVHLFTFAVAVVGIVIADKSAFSWMSGRTPLMHGDGALRLHYLMSGALSMMIVTGMWMFWPQKEYLLQDTYFLIKMGLVLALIINSVAIERLMPIAISTPYAQVPSNKRILLTVAGAVSFVSWFGAATVAYLLFGWLF